jgi:hypothetical protein
MPTEVTSAPQTSPELNSRVELHDVRLDIDPEIYSANYNKIPFGFTHNLHHLEIFQFDAICDLAARYATASENDYFVAGSAIAADSAFFAAEHIKLRPREAIEHLNDKPTRILLKRLENHDPKFRELLETIVKQLRTLPGGLGNQAIKRVQSSLFITSAAATTALHFDPEVAFFTQIEGDKEYHAFPPAQVAEAELEEFYSRGRVSIGQLDMATLNPAEEHLFELKAGHGFHQPQNSPHWVQTRATRSISYSLVFETTADKALGLTRAFNHFERKLGMNPAVPGAKPKLDSFKSEVIVPVRFARKVVSKLRNG